MLKHGHGREEQGSRVDDVHACNIETRVSSSLSEEDVVLSDASTSHQTDTSSDTSADVAHDRSVQVGHNHDVELGG